MKRVNPKEILANWSSICHNIVESEKINPQEVAQELDSVRDEWINTDLEGWLALHRFYPGVIARINQIMHQTTKLYIVTTKEGRFVTKLLYQVGIEMESSFIFGKECQRPKYQTLQLILNTAKKNSANLWFVEDRLKTLQLIKQ